MDTFPKMKRLCFPDLKVKEQKTDYYYQLKNGSEIWIAGLDDSQRVEKILGKEYSTIWFNEVSQMDFRSIQMAITRLAEKNDLKKKIYYDMNPPTKSHWSYYQFIKKLNPEDNTPLVRPDIFTSFLMNPGDNAKNIDENYLNLLATLPERDKKRFLEGQFLDSDDGSAYYAFDIDRHVQETRIEPGSLFVLMDFNVNPMTATIAQVQDDRLVIHDEVFLSGNSDTYKMCNELKRRGYEGLEAIPDSTGKNRKTSGMSDFQILTENGFKVLNVLNPLARDRVTNVNRLFHNDKIIINKKCVKLINDLQKVVWKDGDLFEGQDGMLTHISDGLGYGAWKLFPMIKKKENSQIQL